MKDKPYPISGHACFYPERVKWYGEGWPHVHAPLLAPKRVVKRAKKKKASK